MGLKEFLLLILVLGRFQYIGVQKVIYKTDSGYISSTVLYRENENARDVLEQKVDCLCLRSIHAG